MTNIHVNRLAPLRQLRGEMDRLFEDFFTPVASTVYNASVFPAVNVWERDAELFAEAELPGVRSEDLELSVVGNELTLKGKRAEPTTDGVMFHRRERGTGEFVRVIRLPVEIDAEKVQAALRDGVLLVTLPKAEASRPRKIDITGG